MNIEAKGQRLLCKDTTWEGNTGQRDRVERLRGRQIQSSGKAGADFRHPDTKGGGGAWENPQRWLSQDLGKASGPS